MKKRDEQNISSIPSELTANREAIECNVIFSLWKDPTLYEDYSAQINPQRDLLSLDAKFYFRILSDIRKIGYETADQMVVTNYLSERDLFRREFEKRGGYATVLEITDAVDPNNIEGYYDELVKSNMLINLHKNGFDVLSNLDHYQGLTSAEVYDEFEYLLNDICASGVDKLTVENLSEGYEKYIDQWDAGLMQGSPIGFPLLNRRLMGIHKKNLILHMAHIGNGKTTSAILFYIMPALQSGIDVCIIANEQDVSEFRQMVLSTVVCNILDKKDMNRSKFIEGNFTEQQREDMRDGEELLRSFPGTLYMIETRDYSIGNVKKIVKKMSKRGCSLFIFDTMKPTVESTERAWAEFSEVAKQLFLLAKQCDVAIIATAQLSSDSMSRRYLDLSCVGKSRAIAETATQVIMFRTITRSEIENNTISAFIYEDVPGYARITKNIKLDEDKEYVVLFTPKNRFGSVGPPIIYERNMDYNSLIEIGYADVDFDGFNRRG